MAFWLGMTSGMKSWCQDTNGESRFIYVFTFWQQRRLILWSSVSRHSAVVQQQVGSNVLQTHASFLFREAHKADISSSDTLVNTSRTATRCHKPEDSNKSSILSWDNSEGNHIIYRFNRVFGSLFFTIQWELNRTWRETNTKSADTRQMRFEATLILLLCNKLLEKKRAMPHRYKQPL